jgi:ribosomal protein S18 acetylase RimI-like enzyme
MASTELAERALGAADLAGAERLVEQAGWNQVAADWRIFLELGQAFAVQAEGGRPAATAAILPLAATAAILPYPSGFGWISMVLVDAAFRRRGIATRLLGRCIEALQALDSVPVLDATPAGREVYKPLGFRDGWPITRWRRNKALGGEVAQSPVRRLTEADWESVLALDAAAFGCDRAPLLTRLRGRSRDFACVAERGGKLCGFLLGRDGRVATQLGPIVAEDEDAAASLAGWAAARVASPLIVDALERHAGLARCLEKRGFQRERPFTRMALGQDRLFGDPQRTAAIAGPELG